MKLRSGIFAIFAMVVMMFGASSISFAQAPATSLPDPWPRDVSVPGAAVLVYQPQINNWVDNRIHFRAAVAIKPTGAQEECYGVIFVTARTQVDKMTRMVVFENIKITKSDFPTLPDHGARYAAELEQGFASHIETISMDRLQATLAAAGIKPPTAVLNNTPPLVFVSYSSAILVPIDGAPVLRPVPGHSELQRVFNTRALILRVGAGDSYFLHVYDGWLTSSALKGPWVRAGLDPAVR
jgi:hypothetical protein